MTTRTELNKEAKAAGVESPETLANATEVKEATDVARDTRSVYHFPEHQISVVAKDREEADNKLKQALKGNNNE